MSSRLVHKAAGAIYRERKPSWYIAPMLACLGPLRPLYRALGVDARSLEHLIEAKLLLGDRHKGRAKSEGTWGQVELGIMLLLYVGIGGLFALASPILEGPLMYLGVFSTLLFVLLLMPLLMDFSTILVDTSDLEVLGPLPISDRTMVAVRVTHLGLFVGILVVATCAVPLVAGCLRFSPWIYVPAFLLSAIQVAILAVSAVVVLYLTAIKRLDLSRFRDALVYLQSGAFLLFYAGMQLGPHLATRSGLSESLAQRPEWMLAVPTLSGGALLRSFAGEGQALDPWIALSGWGITLAVGGLALFLARGGVISSLSQLERADGKTRLRARAHGISGRVAGRLAKGKLERAGWSFFVIHCSTDRQFKMRSVPMLGIALMPFLMMVVQDPEEEMEFVRQSLTFLPYMLLFITPSLWFMAGFGENWEGRWIFDQLEDGEQEAFTRGAMKAAFVRFMLLPLALFMLVAGLFGQPSGLLAYAFAAALTLSACALLIPMGGRRLPFARKFTQSLASGNLLTMILATLAAGFLGASQYLLFRFVPLAPILALLLLPSLWWSWFHLSRVRLRQAR